MICIESVKVTPENLTLQTGDWFYDLRASITPTDAICQRVFWYSDTPSVATVDAFYGSICAVGPGKAKIYAIATDESQIQDCCTVTVTEAVSISSIVLNRTQMILEKGANEKLTATVLPYHVENRGLKWNSSNPHVASVNNGYVHACNIGGATISVCAADDSHIVASCYVVVTNNIPVSHVTVTPAQAPLTIGQEIDLEAEISPRNATNRNVIWRSGDPEIATVDPKSGHVCAKAAGCTSIIATADDNSEKHGSCLVTVDPPIRVERMILNRNTLTLGCAASYTLTARVLPADASNKHIKWSSSAPTVAIVDPTTGTVTAKAAGKAAIIANSQDGSGTYAACAVTVKECNVHKPFWKVNE